MRFIKTHYIPLIINVFMSCLHFLHIIQLQYTLYLFSVKVLASFQIMFTFASGNFRSLTEKNNIIT